MPVALVVKNSKVSLKKCKEICFVRIFPTGESLRGIKTLSKRRISVDKSGFWQADRPFEEKVGKYAKRGVMQRKSGIAEHPPRSLSKAMNSCKHIVGKTTEFEMNLSRMRHDFPGQLNPFKTKTLNTHAGAFLR